MYIKKIILKNIRCFEEIEIDLTSGDDVRKWAVILGDNGVGKTTLLRSIAMGLCDRTSAAGLLGELYGDWPRNQRHKNGETSIYIEFKPEKKGRKNRYIKTIIEPIKKSGYSKVRQETFPKRFPWDDIFVCGYGSARRAFGTKDYDDYAVTDAVYTLFNYDSPLQNPELIIRRLIGEKNGKKKILNLIDEILMLPRGSTCLTNTGIQIRGNWGLFVPLGALGDGYQATLAWIVDLLGWAMLYDAETFKKEIRGIVLLDEIEHHLHPKWQRSIIALLRKQFPHIQFITTTHSPLIAAGTANLSDKEYTLSLLYLKHKGLIEKTTINTLRGYRADQILTSDAFGLPETRDEKTQNKLDRFRKLFLKKNLKADEKKELKNLRQTLEQEAPGLAEKEEDRQLERKLRGFLMESPD